MTIESHEANADGVFAAIMAGLILLAVACQPKPAPPAQSITPASVQPTATSIAKVEAYNDVLAQKAETEPQEPIGESKPLIAAQGEEISNANDELVGLKRSIDGMMAEHDLQIAKHVLYEQGQEEAYRKLDGQWYVKWGRRIDLWLNVLKWSVAGLIALTIVTSALKGMGGPIGMAGSLIYGLCLSIWTGGMYLVGRAFRWGRTKWIPDAE